MYLILQYSLSYVTSFVHNYSIIPQKQLTCSNVTFLNGWQSLPAYLFNYLDHWLAVLMGLKAFINLAPSHIVDKYMHGGGGADSADIVDGEYVREPTDKELHETVILNSDKANGRG